MKNEGIVLYLSVNIQTLLAMISM